MTIASGVFKQVIIGKETTWGVKAAVGAGVAMRRVTNANNYNIKSFESNEIRIDQQTADMRLGSRSTTCKLSEEMSCGTFQLLWAALLRAGFAAGATTGPLTTISANNSGNKLTRASGSWTTDGFYPGDIVTVSGFTAPATANNAQWTVVNVANGGLDLVLFSATGATIVTKTAGDSVTVACLGKKCQVPLSGHTNDSFTMEERYTDVGVVEVSTGKKVTMANINIQPNGMAKVDFTLMGKDLLDNSGTNYFTTVTPVSTNSVLAGTRGEIYVGTTPSGVVTGLTVDINGNHQVGDVIGSLYTPDVFPGRVTVQGQFTAYFQDQTMFTNFINEVEFGLFFQLDGASGQSFCIKLPRLKITSYSRDDKEVGGLIATIQYRALLNSSQQPGEGSTICLQDTLAT